MSLADTEATVQRFIEAMAGLADEHAGRSPQAVGHVPPFRELRTESLAEFRVVAR